MVGLKNGDYLRLGVGGRIGERQAQVVAGEIEVGDEEELPPSEADAGLGQAAQRGGGISVGGVGQMDASAGLVESRLILPGEEGWTSCDPLRSFSPYCPVLSRNPSTTSV